MNYRYICLLLFILISASSVALADDDGLDASTSMKVNRAKRHKSMDKSNTQSSNSVGNNNSTDDPCKGVEIGNVYTDSKRGPTPRENTVVVTGDVINIPSNRCR
jgi:hypothetical protein